MYTVYTNTRLQFYFQLYQIFPSAVYSTYLPTSILVCKDFADTFHCSAISCNHYSAHSVVVICDGISAGDVSISGLSICCCALCG